MRLSDVFEIISRQYYIHRKIREAIINIFYPKLLDNFEYKTDFFGMKYFGNTASYIDREVLMRGAYEKFLLFFMRDAIAHVSNENSVFLDVGANVGHHSLYMSKFARYVHAFEPYITVRSKLYELIHMNNLKNIIVHEEGLSNIDRMLPFVEPETTNLGNGYFLTSDETEISNRHSLLRVVCGDDLIKSHGIRGVEIIKIDVEGHEKYVLEGLKDTISSNRPLVIFEYSDTTQKGLPTIEPILDHFPQGYLLCYFSKRNKKSGSYRVSMLQSTFPNNLHQIIAVPLEKYSGFAPFDLFLQSRARNNGG